MDDLLTAGNTQETGRRARLRWQRLTEPAPSSASFTARDAVLMSIWFGLFIGASELALTMALKPLRDPSAGFFRMNRHIVWTIPTVSLLVFGLCGLISALVVRLRPGWGVRLTGGLNCFVGLLTLLLTVHRIYPWACLILAFGLSCRLAARIESNLDWCKRAVRLTLPLLAVLVGASTVYSGGGHLLRERQAMARALAMPLGKKTPPNVILLVLDTVRADRLSLYGYSRPTTPNLERLARRGVSFQQARSTAPWTLPSHCSILTGRYPHQISAGLHGPLDDTHPTLAGYLASHGYVTAGFVANTTYCGKETGLGRGFAHYEDHDLSPWGIFCSTALGGRLVAPALAYLESPEGKNLKSDLRKDAERINHDMLAWIDQQGDRPFFTFANYFDAHNPYLPPASHTRSFGIKPETSKDYETLDRWFILDKKTLSPRDVQLVTDAYDDCIASLDEQLGKLFDALESRGKLENTLVLITADHGEHFGEHALYGHASSLYDQEIRVPLLALLPGKAHAGESVSQPVSLRNLPSTVTDVLKLSNDSAQAFPGESLTRYLETPNAQPEAPVLSEVDAPVKAAPNQGRSPVFRGPMKALTLGNEVYIRNGDGVEEVFDIQADPRQTQNLANTEAVQARLSRYRKHLDELTRDDRRPAEWRGTLAKPPGKPENE